MIAVIDATPTLGAAPACRVLGLSRASLYRGRRPAAVARPRPAPPRALTVVERQGVLDLLHTRFVDQAPAHLRGLFMKAIVVGRLPAAGLVRREVDRAPIVPQEPHDGHPDPRREGIRQAGYEKGHVHREVSQLPRRPRPRVRRNCTRSVRGVYTGAEGRAETRPKLSP